jgi:DNA ligase (NAD+)
MKKSSKECIEKTREYLLSLPTLSEIEQLRNVIRFHEWRYYETDEALISDQEFDRLFNHLRSLESENPTLITSDSPTQRVAGSLNPDFPAVRHLNPMLSLGNAYSEQDLLDFHNQILKITGESTQNISYTAEPKFDGGSVALLYENDLFIRAATRGNGQEGEEMTPNARSLPSVPLKAAFSKFNIHRAELRGEAVIRKDLFNRINHKRAADEESIFANPRNAASGGLRTKNPQETRNRGIEIFIFQLAYAVDQEGNDILDTLPDHSTQLETLSQIGFKVPSDELKVCNKIEDVVTFTKEWEEKREGYPYEIDGIVVKVNSVALQNLCGSTQHHPRWAVAFKFKAKQATTILEGVEYQVGKIGSITPVAKVRPVHLAGVTVSSVSLHNEEFIISRDLHIGDTVVVERAGDVIPYIVKALPELRDGTQKQIEFPTECPIGAAYHIPLKREEDESAWRCPDCQCGAQDLQKIIFHVSKDAMDIDGFGKSYVEKFFELGWLKDIGDVYALDYEKIKELDGFGEKSVEKLASAIEKARQNPIQKTLHSLSIHHLGKKASRLLAEKIDYVLDLKEWNQEDFLSIPDIGPVVANNVTEYFSDQKNIDLLLRMEARGVNLHQKDEDKPISNIEGPLAGKTILFTGALQQLKRQEAQKLAENAGAKNISAVSSNLNILVVGENAGSKLKKASDLGTVEIWTEEDFINIIDNQ